jgi:hypothetical protein
MNETIIRLCALGAVEIACIIWLIVIHFREKKMKKETNILQRSRQLVVRKKETMAEMIDEKMVIKAIEHCKICQCNECPFKERPSCCMSIHSYVFNI